MRVLREILNPSPALLVSLGGIPALDEAFSLPRDHVLTEEIVAKRGGYVLVNEDGSFISGFASAEEAAAAIPGLEADFVPETEEVEDPNADPSTADVIAENTDVTESTEDAAVDSQEPA